MYKILLIIGIIITGLSLLFITIFSISRSILKRINKEEEMAKTKEEKQKDKKKKKALKYSKKVIKKINKFLVHNYIAFYILSLVALGGGAALTAVSTIKVIEENNASKPSVITYNVTWKDENGTILLQNTVGEGAVPTYTTDLPYKAPVDQRQYVFDSWNPAPSAVTSDVTYTATYRIANENIKLTLYSEFFNPDEAREVEVLEGTRLIDYWEYGFEITFANPDETFKLDKLYDNAALSGNPYNLYAPITKPLDIYASYYKEWTISYNVDGGAASFEKVKEGECATGYVEQYEDYTWFDRDNPSVPFDFANTPIYSDYVLDGYLI